MRTFKQFCEIKIPEKAAQIDLPPTRQMDGSACGAAAYRAVLAYWGVDVDSEEEVKDDLGTTEKGGTTPEAIVRQAKAHGLHASLINRMSIERLDFYLRRGIPVICAIQAWANEKKYRDMEAGHYVVVTALTNDHVFFQDPAMAKYRGTLSMADFEKRWKDRDAKGNVYYRLGIPIWSDRKPGDRTERTQARKIQ